MIETLSRDKCRENLDDPLAFASDKQWAWSADQFLLDLPRKWELSFCTDEAVAIMSQRAPGHVHLHWFAVHQDQRGRGRGAVLMDEIKRRAGDALLSLKVPRDEPGAIAFYRRHGFMAVGDPAAQWLAMEFRPETSGP